MSNVLVYTGEGVSPIALGHTLRSLKALLPDYDVQTVDARSLAVDPWYQSTSLLVLPGGRDLPYVAHLGQPHSHAEAYHSQDGAAEKGVPLGPRSALPAPAIAPSPPSSSSSSPSSSSSSRADARIRHYVERVGGSFLGICAGAYYASSRCEFERGDASLEVVGDRPALRFFPGTCRGTAYPGFEYETEAGARLSRMVLEPDAWRRSRGSNEKADQASKPSKEDDDDDDDAALGVGEWICHYNGGGAFLDADAFRDQGVEVLARYPGANVDTPRSDLNPKEATELRKGYEGQAAVVRCRVGKGSALLFGTHPEIPLRYIPAAPSPSSESGKPRSPPTAGLSAERVASMEAQRLRLLAKALRLLGLETARPPRPLAASASPSTASLQPSAPKLTPLSLASRRPGLARSVFEKLTDVAKVRRTSRGDGGASDTTELVNAAEVQGVSVCATLQDQHDTLVLVEGDRRGLETLYAQVQRANYSAHRRPKEASANATEAASGGAQAAGIEDEEEADVDLHKVPKYLLLHTGESSDEPRLSPHFDLAKYFACLETAQRRLAERARPYDGGGGGVTATALGGLSLSGASRSSPTDVPLGEVVMHGELVTSTQTLLDKNYHLLKAVPGGFTAFATRQAAGRGRGRNAWLSPLGCLQFSTLLRLPARCGAAVVFVQYLAALAIVEAVRHGLGADVGRAVGEKLRIKWPNDVYAEVGESETEVESPDPAAASESAGASGRSGTFVHRGKRYAKMAGVLVNSQFVDGGFKLIIGCGINCLNSRPTTSLSDLIAMHNARLTASPPARTPPNVPGGASQTLLPEVGQEELAAAVLSSLDSLCHEFVAAGASFSPFVARYRDAWLHSDQETTLTTVSPPQRVRIVGVTSDFGLLRAVPVSASSSSAVSSQSSAAWGPTSNAPTSSSTSSVNRRGGLDDVDDVEWIDLQPDGNSFDMLQNLLRRKQ